MERRSFLRASVLAGGTILGAPFIQRGRFTLYAGSRTYSRRTLDLVQESIVIDMLSLFTLDWQKLTGWQQDPSTFRPEDFQRLKRSGITVFHPAVEPNQPNPFQATLHWSDNWNRLISAYPEFFVRVNSVDDIRLAKNSGRIAVVLGFQNSEHFRSVRDVGAFHELGQRVSQLTYNSRNSLGDGCVERHDQGITVYGASVVAEMNRIGMVVDVSHAGERTALDALRVSRKPVVISHSNCKALVPRSPRCVSDTVIRALAATGGVLGLTGIRNFVWDGRPVTLNHLLDHYEHVARLVGVEHVGIGSDSDVEDYNGKTKKKRLQFDIHGLDTGTRIYDITEGLLERGYTNRHLELILGGNFLRVLSAVWNQPPVSVS